MSNTYKLVTTAKCALADLEGIMPKFEPSGDRTHPAWTTIKELKTALEENAKHDNAYTRLATGVTIDDAVFIANNESDRAVCWLAPLDAGRSLYLCFHHGDYGGMNDDVISIKTEPQARKVAKDYRSGPPSRDGWIVDKEWK